MSVFLKGNINFYDTYRVKHRMRPLEKLWSSQISNAKDNKVKYLFKITVSLHSYTRASRNI